MRVLLVAALKGGLYQLDLSQLDAPLKPNLHAFVSSLNGNMFYDCSVVSETSKSLVCNQSSVCNCTNKNRSTVKSESSFESNVCNTSNNSSVTDVKTWHKRLGHTSKPVLSTVLKAVNCNTNVNKLLFCPDCAIGKLHQFHFSKVETHTSTL